MLALALLVAGAAGAPAAPAELQDHYRDHNFVYAFSTMAERRAVARNAPTDARLRRVAAAMERMERRILDVDAGMVRPVLPRTPGGLTLDDSAAVVRSDLVQITDWRMDEQAGEAWVELECLRLGPQAVGHLIAQYPKLAPEGRQPRWDDLVRASGGRLIQTNEVHHWVLTEDGWRRDRATRVFTGSAVTPRVIR